MENHLSLISIIISIIAIAISIKTLANFNDYLFEKRKELDLKNPDLCIVDEKSFDSDETKEKYKTMKIEAEIRILQKMVRIKNTSSKEYIELQKKLDTLKYGLDIEELIKNIKIN